MCMRAHLHSCRPLHRRCGTEQGGPRQDINLWATAASADLFHSSLVDFNLQFAISGDLGGKTNLKISKKYFRNFQLSHQHVHAHFAAKCPWPFFVFYLEINFLKLDLRSKEPIESFWDALWLGIQLFLCFISEKSSSKIKFATERTDRELLGRPVARHSAVFVFYLRKIIFSN